jgi:hypothetical protein
LSGSSASREKVLLWFFTLVGRDDFSAKGGNGELAKTLKINLLEYHIFLWLLWYIVNK